MENLTAVFRCDTLFYVNIYRNARRNIRRNRTHYLARRTQLLIGMTKEFRLALEALARAAGLRVEYECTYCRENCHAECEPDWHEIVTFIGPAPDED